MAWMQLEDKDGHSVLVESSLDCPMILKKEEAENQLQIVIKAAVLYSAK